MIDLLRKIYRRLKPKSYEEIQRQRVQPWFAVNGDGTLRLDYPLSRGSIVFDIGGYEGEWAHQIHSRYHCNIHIFEPVEEFAKAINTRFSNIPAIRTNPFGLGGISREEEFYISDDSSSSIKKGEKKITVPIRSFEVYLAENGIDKIDLMKVNIEGGEYELLEHINDRGLTTKIIDLQVQFHAFVPGAVGRMKAIQKELSKTHRLTYQYEFVWENWRLK